MKFKENLVLGYFIKRLNKFLAEVRLEENGTVVQVHVPDPGRLKELLLPKSEVLLREEKETTKRKTKYTLVYVKGKEKVWVNIESQFTSNIFSKDFNSYSEFRDYMIVKPEYKYKSSRIDFLLKKLNNNQRALVEIKGVTLVLNKTALFPDAPTTRGRKHLHDLITSVKEGYGAFIVFIVKRDDADLFSPNWNTDPKFSETLVKAVKAGVKVLCYKYKFEPEKKKITFVSRIPLVLKQRNLESRSDHIYFLCDFFFFYCFLCFFNHKPYIIFSDIASS